MTDKATHTPLPWKVEEGHIQRDSNGIRYWQITDGQDAIACNQFCYAGYDPEVNAANAAFIVHAVNSHHDLIEAFRGLLDEIGKSACADTILDSAAAGKAFAAIAEVEGRRG